MLGKIKFVNMTMVSLSRIRRAGCSFLTKDVEGHNPLSPCGLTVEYSLGASRWETPCPDGQIS